MNTTERTFTRWDGVFIYALLVILTLIEVGIVMLNIPKATGAALMGFTTLLKVGMIGLYFMHLRFDRRLAWLLPTVPIVLAVFFVLMLFPDLVFHLPLKFR